MAIVPVWELCCIAPSRSIFSVYLLLDLFVCNKIVWKHRLHLKNQHVNTQRICNFSETGSSPGAACKAPAAAIQISFLPNLSKFLIPNILSLLAIKCICAAYTITVEPNSWKDSSNPLCYSFWGIGCILCCLYRVLLVFNMTLRSVRSEKVYFICYMQMFITVKNITTRKIPTPPPKNNPNVKKEWNVPFENSPDPGVSVRHLYYCLPPCHFTMRKHEHLISKAKTKPSWRISRVHYRQWQSVTKK